MTEQPADQEPAPPEEPDEALPAEASSAEEKEGTGSSAYPIGYGGAPTYVREAPKVGRNDPCPCGSGRKFKKCCARA